MKAIAYLIEFINWLKIALSPTLIGGIVGVLIYFSYPNLVGLAIGVFFGLAGFVLGLIWATRTWKRKGTTNFMSNVHASPDIDELLKPKKDD
ncbi:MAG: hypothetical protein WC044_09960 [Crocinitomicaceae bacterium]